MKITVAIPTVSGRTVYLESCLLTCISQAPDNVEILVSDNSEGTSKEMVRAIDDPRIRYIQPPEYLPMSAHWDFVISRASGDFITFIGDDDGLMPGCISRVNELISEYGCVPIHHSLCNYHWPDYLIEEDRNSVDFFHLLDTGTRWVKSSDFMRDICQGSLRYVDGPMVYHNFVPLPLIRRLARNEVFFRRSSPDVYSSIALAANTDKFLSVGEMLTISGQGSKANGVSVRMDGSVGRQFLSEMNSPLYQPRFESRTIQMQLLDSVLEVSEEFGMSQLADDLDFASHLWQAIREVMRFRGKRNKVKECLQLLKLSREKGVLIQLLSDMGLGAVRKFTQSAKAISEPSTHDPLLDHGRGVHDRLVFGSDVANIYQASLELNKLIRNNPGGLSGPR